MKSSVKKKIAGAIFLVVGVAFIIFGSIITTKVNQGREKVQRAQKTVNTIKKVTRISPYTREAGKIATKPAQHKINKGKQEVHKYRGLSVLFLIIGVSLAVCGGILYFWGYFQKKP